MDTAIVSSGNTASLCPLGPTMKAWAWRIHVKGLDVESVRMMLPQSYEPNPVRHELAPRSDGSFCSPTFVSVGTFSVELEICICSCIVHVMHPLCFDQHENWRAHEVPLELALTLVDLDELAQLNQPMEPLPDDPRLTSDGFEDLLGLAPLQPVPVPARSQLLTTEEHDRGLLSDCERLFAGDSGDAA